MSKVQAIILAGGKGSRLRPYTTVLPKPLVPIGGMPIIEVIIRQLKFFGINNIVIAVGYLAELIETYLGNGKRWGVSISYVKEEKPLGTAGAIKLVKNLSDDFIVINGDTLTNMDFRSFIHFHKKSQAIATLGIKERILKTDFGVIESQKDGSFVNYIEKPDHRSDVSLGVNVFNKQVQSFIKKNEPMNMPELFLKMRSLGKRIVCFKTDKMWLDLGRFEDLELAQEIFEKNKKKFLKG
ncbi:MAG TPA: sugar phosphate nucleotidyltransferase [Candidatus Omnitrophota bacterium]|nr:sugar phosphate nucleotidyltransferase [Candidatus Omnitrophota bacterium]